MVVPNKKLISFYSEISAYFALGYFFITYFLKFEYGQYLMLTSAAVLYLLKILHKKGANEFILNHIYILYCYFVVFSLCVFSGGGNSPVLPWFCLIPAVSLLLIGDRAAYFNLGLSCLGAVILFLIDTSHFIPSLQYKPIYTSFYNLQLSLGLTGIIFLIVLIFAERSLKLEKSLTYNIDVLSSTEEELRQNFEELTSTQNYLTNSNDQLQESIRIQSEINTKLIQSKNLIANRKERQTVYNSRLNNITKGNLLYSGDLKKSLSKLMEESATCLETSRAGIWYFNKEKDTLTCSVQFDFEKGEIGINSTLKKRDFPIYMQAILNENSVIANDARTDPYTQEFNEIYFKPNNIFSLLDIPLFVDGEHVGVICFEQKNQPRKWEEEDISFAQSIVDLTAIAIYASQKRESLLEIKNQYIENECQRAKLETLSQQLKMSNFNLEEKVKERTRELEEKNNYLAEYTFINVHLLRGPLCRIIGLTNLLCLDKHRDETLHLLNLLIESNQELESLIKKITVVLEAGESLNRDSLN